MRVWAIANQKGGVGKTTTVACLGGLLAESGYRVLMVDLDPQTSLTSYLGFESDSLACSVFDLFREDFVATRNAVHDLLQPLDQPNIHLLPASPALATVERKAAQDGMGRRLSKALKLIQDDFDIVLVDTPPVLGALMINALAAAEHLLIPVQTEHLAMKGLERMLRTLVMVTRSLGKELPYLIIPTMFDRRTHASVVALRELRNMYQGSVWPAMIPVDTGFRDASKAGQLPSRFRPSSRGVEAYRSLLKALPALPGKRLRA